MKIKSIIKKATLLSACLFAFILSNSCYKEHDTLAIITVLNNTNDQPIPGAIVRLYYEDPTGQNTSIIDVEKETASDGIAAFNFTEEYKSGQAGFAVLDIDVNGSFQNVIQVEEMATNELTIYL